METKSTLRGGLFFLLAVLLGYGIAFLLDPASPAQALDRSAALLVRLLPALGLAVLVLFLSSLLLRPDWVRTNLSERVRAVGSWPSSAASCRSAPSTPGTPCSAT